MVDEEDRRQQGRRWKKTLLQAFRVRARDRQPLPPRRHTLRPNDVEVKEGNQDYGWRIQVQCRSTIHGPGVVQMMVQQLRVGASSSLSEAAITPGRLAPDIMPDRVDGSLCEARKLA